MTMWTYSCTSWADYRSGECRSLLRTENASWYLPGIYAGSVGHYILLLMFRHGFLLMSPSDVVCSGAWWCLCRVCLFVRASVPKYC